jgi:hypothetical protein
LNWLSIPGLSPCCIALEATLPAHAFLELRYEDIVRDQETEKPSTRDLVRLAGGLLVPSTCVCTKLRAKAGIAMQHSRIDAMATWNRHSGMEP